MALVDRRGNESELQRQLRDLVCLAVVGDHVRWVLTDDDELGEWLADAAGQWREWAHEPSVTLLPIYLGLTRWTYPPPWCRRAVVRRASLRTS